MINNEDKIKRVMVQISIDSDCRFSTKKEDQEYLKLPHDNYGWIRCVGEIIEDDLYYKGKKVLSMTELKKYSQGKYYPKEEKKLLNDDDESCESETSNISDEIEFDDDDNDDDNNDDNGNSDDGEIKSRAISGKIKIIQTKDGKTKSIWKSTNTYNDDNSEYCPQYKNDDSCVCHSVYLCGDSHEKKQDDLWYHEIFLDGIKITNAWLMLCVYYTDNKLI